MRKMDNNAEILVGNLPCLHTDSQILCIPLKGKTGSTSSLASGGEVLFRHSLMHVPQGF